MAISVALYGPLTPARSSRSPSFLYLLIYIYECVHGRGQSSCRVPANHRRQTGISPPLHYQHMYIIAIRQPHSIATLIRLAVSPVLRAYDLLLFLAAVRLRRAPVTCKVHRGLCCETVTPSSFNYYYRVVFQVIPSFLCTPSHFPPWIVRNSTRPIALAYFLCQCSRPIGNAST